MFASPANFNHYLTKHDRVDEIYDVMDNEDLGKVVIKALMILKSTEQLAPWKPFLKSEEMSDKFRNLGNDAYRINNHRETMSLYNQALLHAPKDSKQFRLALSNRSALLQKLKAYRACNQDIDSCFSLGCSEELLRKLEKRRMDILPLIKTEEKTAAILNRSVDNYITCNMARNPRVPCASRYVNIIGTESHKVVASVDIRVGTIVSAEKAYVSYTDSLRLYLACYYCQRFALNLIPCDNCCFVMFCDYVCKSKCNDEYHKYECRIMNIINDICDNNSTMTNLMRKVVLKMRSKSKSWTELINASYKSGLKRMKMSSPDEIYDRNNIFSVLNTSDDRPFVYGLLYNACFVGAALIHYFEEIPGFYPKDPNQKFQAMQALGRIMLFVAIYQKPIHIYQAVTNVNDGQSQISDLQNYGIYSFTGKLKHSCKPNLFVINRNNELILLAMRKIKCGEELTISYQQHLLDTHFERRTRNINNYIFCGDVCDCALCTGYETLNSKDQLSTPQKKYYITLDFGGIDKSLKCVHLANAFYKLMGALDILGDVPHSDEYEEVFKRFRMCIMFYETIKGGNYILDTIE